MIVVVVVAVQVVSVNFILQSPGAVVLLCVRLPVSVGGLCRCWRWCCFCCRSCFTCCRRCMTRISWLCNISMSCRCCRCCRCCVCCCICWSCSCCCKFCTCVFPLAPLPPPLGCGAGRCFSRMLVMPVDNISARSEQCHDKYDITILAYSSFSILVIPLLPLN